MRDNLTGQEKEVSKIIGFQLSQNVAPNIDSTVFHDLLMKALRRKNSRFRVDQLRSFKSGPKISQELVDFYLTNDLKTKRVIFQDGTTLPFGYTNEMASEQRSTLLFE